MITIDEKTLEDVVARLQAVRGEWPRISTETGIPYGTLAKIGGGFTADPRLSTLVRLARWLEAHAPEAA